MERLSLSHLNDQHQEKQNTAHERSQPKDADKMLDSHPIPPQYGLADPPPPSQQTPRKEPCESPLNCDDWTKYLPPSDHVDYFISTDWPSTPLGDLSSWHSALRLHCFTLFADSRPSCIYWGISKVAIYNAPFVPLAGKAHPALMGQTFEQAFPEIWDTIIQVFDEAERTGMAADVIEQQLFVERNGFMEEAYFTGNFNPLRDDLGHFGGFYNSVHEITRQKITERRTAMLNSMVAPLIMTPDAEYIIPFLEKDPFDIPMAMVYKVDKESDPGKCMVFLCGSIGVPPGHPLAIEKADIVSSDPLIRLLREAHSEVVTRPVDEMFDGIEWKGFGEPSKFYSIIPIRESNCLYGFMIVGANPRRPVDQDHHQFMVDLQIKACSIAATVVGTQETFKYKKRLIEELESSERQIRFFAEHASVGMQNLSVDGKQVVWANQTFYQITGLPREIEAVGHKLRFFDVILEEDRLIARSAFKQVIEGEHNVSAELRLKRMFNPPFGVPEHACILALSFPYMENGKVSSVMTCVTDVSRLKWAERFEARKAEEALEGKRRANEFVDIVSHELRNPLSAVFQCADAIQSSSKTCELLGYSKESLMEALQNNVDSAETISMCAKHQKTIVDDILTLSKFEYTMPSLNPEPITPKGLVSRVVKMFESDLTSHHIKIVTELRTSLPGDEFEWIQGDPSRMNQILINLITNSIKFTKDETKREIIVRYGATLSEPRKMFPEDIAWAKNRDGMKDLTLDPAWGNGEHVYLCVSVSDTGVGMTEDEMNKVFDRFEQAGSKTMVQYSGSGLGLYISQRYTEMQGGEIGVASVPNKGSTFAFYVKGRRAESEAVALRMKQPELGGRTKSSSRSSTPTLNTQITNGFFAGQIHTLLVEDNVINQRVLKKQLVQADCVVHVANHGIEALQFLPETDIWHEKTEECKHLDIILMDWEMPEMDGLTCASKIRELQKDSKINKHIQIIAITANARDEQIEEALASGIDCVMSKPFIVSDLLSKMREQLRHVEG